MPRKLRLVAFLCCLMPVLFPVVLRLFDRPRTLTPHRHGVTPSPPTVDVAKRLSLVTLGLGFIGAAGLLVDAIRRPSDSAKAVSVAVAGLGLITFGLASIPYYLIWGIQPTPDERGQTAASLCGDCLSATVDRSAPGTGLHNLMGTSLIGSSDPCPHCGSIIRTGWVVLLLPVIPFASYRTFTLPSASLIEARNVGRKLKGIFWPQVIAMYLTLAVFAGLGWWFLYGMHR